MKEFNMKAFLKRIDSPFIRDCINVFMTKYSIYVLAMITSVVTARALGPEGKGTQGVIVALAGVFTQFGGFGLTSANTYYIAKNVEDRYAIMGNSYLMTGAASCIVLICCLSSAKWIQFFSFGEKELVFAACLFLIQLLNLYQNNCLIAMGRIKAYSMSEMIPVILYLVFILVGAYTSQLTPYSLIALSIICYGIAWIYSYKKSMLPIARLCISLEYLKKQFSYGIIIYIICFFQYLILRVDVLMINAYLGAGATGLYSVAVNLIDTINMIFTAVGMLVFPKIAAMDNKKEEIAFMKKIIVGVLVIALITVILGFLFSGPVITILYGRAYAESVRVFNYLLLGILFRAVVTLENNYIAGKNKNKKVLFIIFICFCVNIILNRVWIPRIGITGAAMASNISYMLMCIFTTLILWNMVKKE